MKKALRLALQILGLLVLLAVTVFIVLQALPVVFSQGQVPERETRTRQPPGGWAPGR